jgi:hypothetical protein
MKTCDTHNIVFEEWTGRDRKTCPVCEAEGEISRHEVNAEKDRHTISDMLEALKLAEDALDIASNEHPTFIKMRNVCRAAIAKAEGRE